jgi:hypothetical protein
MMLPSSVTDIRIYAFYLCENLDVVIDNTRDSVSVGSGAFEGCKSVTFLKDNDSTAVDTSATPLRFRITSDSTAEVIKGDSYDSYIGFRSITIPEKVKIDGKVYDVTSIGEYAFKDCGKLVRIEIPQSIKVIKRGAFMACDSLRTVELPESLDSIGNAVFCECENLESINIPKNITCIGDSTFEWCYNLRHIEIPEKVSNIKFYAFFECTNLDVIIDNSEDNVRIGKEAFKGCKSVTFLKENDQTAIDTSATPLRFRITSDSTAEVINKNGKDYDYHYYDENVDSIISIPAKIKIDGKIYSVTSIGYKAFYDNRYLTHIEIPEGITCIGKAAFDSCQNIKNIVIPESVTIIEDSAFCCCIELNDIIIPKNVISIGKGAFADCRSLTRIKLPENLASIGNWAFEGCHDLYDIEIPEKITYIGQRAFSYCNLSPRLLIYDNGTKCYGWIGNTEECTNVTIPESVTTIGDNAFYYCSKLTNIEIPSNVTNIGAYAFANTNLTSIEIPKGVTNIGANAFDGCVNLTNINVATDNSNYLFEDGILYDKKKTKLIFAIKKIEGDIVVPSSVTSIEPNAFSKCSNLTGIEIPENITIIEKTTFSGCSKLANINIPKTVTSIGWYAFQGCSSLTSITIPESVTKIESSAFYNCNNLEVTIDNSKDNIKLGYDVFYHCKSVTYLK